MAQNLRWRVAAVTQGRDKSYAKYFWDHAEPNVPERVCLKDSCQTVEFYVTKTGRTKALFSLTNIEAETETKNLE